MPSVASTNHARRKDRNRNYRNRNRRNRNRRNRNRRNRNHRSRKRRSRNHRNRSHRNWKIASWPLRRRPQAERIPFWAFCLYHARTIRKNQVEKSTSLRRVELPLNHSSNRDWFSTPKRRMVGCNRQDIALTCVCSVAFEPRRPPISSAA